MNGGERNERIFLNVREERRVTGIIAAVSHVAGHKRRDAHARFSIGTTLPPLLLTRGTTTALASSSRAVAMYLA